MYNTVLFTNLIYSLLKKIWFFEKYNQTPKGHILCIYNMLWYHERIKGMQWIGETIHAYIGRIDDADVGYTLTLLHILLVFGIYGIILTTRSPLLLSVATLCLGIQFVFNLIDNGCFMLKTERKYLGKEWFSFYTLVGDFLGVSMNCSRVSVLYYVSIAICWVVIVCKYIVWIKKWICFLGFLLRQFHILPVLSSIMTYILSLCGSVFGILATCIQSMKEVYSQFEEEYSHRHTDVLIHT